jgi:hypothetical protein
MNVFIFITNFQNIFPETLAVALITSYVNIGKKLQIHLNVTTALTIITPASFDIKEKELWV